MEGNMKTQHTTIGEPRAEYKTKSSKKVEPSTEKFLEGINYTGNGQGAYYDGTEIEYKVKKKN